MASRLDGRSVRTRHLGLDVGETAGAGSERVVRISGTASADFPEPEPTTLDRAGDAWFRWMRTSMRRCRFDEPGQARFMRTAVSIPDATFEEADELAARLGLSRSELYARALERYPADRRAPP